MCFCEPVQLFALRYAALLILHTTATTTTTWYAPVSLYYYHSLIFLFSFCFSLSFPFALSAMRNPKLPLWFLNGESTADALKKQPVHDHQEKASILLSSSHKHTARQKTSTKTRRKTAKTQKQRKTKRETQFEAKTHTSSTGVSQREAPLPHKPAHTQAYACVNVACSQSQSHEKAVSEDPDKKAIVLPVIYQRNNTSSVSPSPTVAAASNSSSQSASSFAASIPSSIPSSIPLCSSSLVVPALSPVPSPLSTVSSHTTSVPSSVPTSSSSSSSSRTCTLDHTHLLPHSSASFAMPHSTPVSEGISISLAAIPPCEPTVLIIMYLLIEFCFGVLLLCWFAFIMVVLENEQSLSERSAE